MDGGVLVAPRTAVAHQKTVRTGARSALGPGRQPPPHTAAAGPASLPLTPCSPHSISWLHYIDNKHSDTIFLFTTVHTSRFDRVLADPALRWRDAAGRSEAPLPPPVYKLIPRPFHIIDLFYNVTPLNNIKPYVAKLQMGIE